MNLSRWLNQRKPDWEKLENLLNSINADGVKSLTNQQILNIGSLYRSVSADLSRARANNVGEQITDYLNDLTSRAHNYVYRLPPMKISDVIKFFHYEFPSAFRKVFPLFILALSVFWIGSAIAMISVHNDPTTASRLFVDEGTIEMLQQGKVWTEEAEASPITSRFIIANNIRIAVMALAYGILFGVGTLFILFYNGFAIGGSLQVVIEYGLGTTILTFISAHGVIELFTIYVAGASGLMIGWALIDPGEYKRWDAVKLRVNIASKLILGCVVLLVIAGTIEGLISANNSIPPYIKYSIAALSAVALIYYFGFIGRNGNKISK